ncbi:MAG: HAMP domain-containing histidine kinase, partial [Acidobacteriota bacterium]|nr:HAMP domain-containing histidine kinase [Acidobacteriota bacterium]
MRQARIELSGPGLAGRWTPLWRWRRSDAIARLDALLADTDRRYVEAAWVVFAAANYAAMIAFPSWETIPFHFVWISLTLLYGFRVWPIRPTLLVLGAVMVVTGASIGLDAFNGIQLWGELFEVPLMAAMFLAMVWHARRRQAVLDSQRRFLADASHELRTPVTIARGHLELTGQKGGRAAEVEVALTELARMQRITERLLLLARAERQEPMLLEDVEVETFLEDVFVAWSEAAPRAWRLDPPPAG